MEKFLISKSGSVEKRKAEESAMGAGARDDPRNSPQEIERAGCSQMRLPRKVLVLFTS